MYAEYVKNGATFLDTREPGWYKRINLEKLNINNRQNCVIGQLYGDYAFNIDKMFPNALDSLELSHSSDSHGFTASMQTLDCDLLTEEWKSVIQARLEMDEMQKQIQTAPEMELVCA